jgi:protoheme ferro-lyase
MILKFLWGILWRTLAFFAVVGAGLWWANRGSDWSGQTLIDAGDSKINGKAGLVIVALAQPEQFDPKFFDNFLEKLFNQVIPWPINVLVGGDNGIALADPDHAYAPEKFEPKRLADIWGREADIDGIPWIEKYRRGQIRWEKPSATTPKDIGYFLYPARKQGMRTVTAKTCLKARYIYYARLPGGVLPHYRQTLDMAEAALALAKSRTPIVAGAVVDAFDPYAKEQAVLRVLDSGIDTLILASAQPIYSQFEELDGSYVAVQKIVKQWEKAHAGKKIKIVIPPYLASQASFDALILERLAAAVPLASAPGQSAMGIMTLHGLPVSLVGKDSWSARVLDVTARLKPKIEALIKAKGYARVEVAHGSEAFADAVEDKSNQIVSVNELFATARKRGDAVAVAVPLEFLAENTDSLFGHAAFMFDGLPGYTDYQAPPANTRWSTPYVRQFSNGKTRMIYAGAPGLSGSAKASEAIASAVASLFRVK